MRTQHIQNIRAKCIEANPDILKLEFGCKVKFDKSYIDYTCVGKDEDYYTYWKDKGDDERHNFTVSERDGWKPIEIIGRDIRLADIILTIEQCITARWLGTLNPGENIGNWQPYLEKSTMTLLGKYNLFKDNLEEQSDETISFINNLLQ